MSAYEWHGVLSDVDCSAHRVRRGDQNRQWGCLRPAPALGALAAWPAPAVRTGAWGHGRPWHPGCARRHASAQSGPMLPAGSYTLDAYGTDTYGVTRKIRIRRDQKSAFVALDLPADRLAFLYGRPAPELRKIKEWKDGAGVRLCDLVGKVVILDFWGYWCGPCTSSMPELMELHDKFADQGLVIVAIHDDTVGSMSELNAKCSKARKAVWGGRDLPFHVAIDGGGVYKVPRRNRRSRGATTSLYGIQGFPTTLVIDKRGILMEDELPTGTEFAEKRIRELLDA